MKNYMKELTTKVDKLISLVNYSDNSDKKYNPISLMDRCNVGMVVPKTKPLSEAFSLISEMPIKVPDLSKGVKADCHFSIEYLIAALNTLKKTDDRVRIRMADDYPIIIENDHIRFIIAPRILTEEDDKIKIDGFYEVKNNE